VYFIVNDLCWVYLHDLKFKRSLCILRSDFTFLVKEFEFSSESLARPDDPFRVSFKAIGKQVNSFEEIRILQALHIV
jgi:hypothetical protein